MSEQTRIIVDRAGSTIVLRSSALAQSQPWETTREFIRRLLSAESVESIVVDRANETVSLKIRRIPAIGAGQPGVQHVNCPTWEEAQAALREIVTRLRTDNTIAPVISDAYSSRSRLQFQRAAAGGAAVAGSIVHAISGRVRIRHPLLRGNSDLSRHATSTLKGIPGIHNVSSNSTTGSVLVSFNQQAVDPDQLLTTIESVLTSRLNELDLLSGPPVRRWIESVTCLGLAVASEFIVPGLAPLTAIALVGSNLPTMKRGMIELATLNWRVAALYTVIMGTTLISGQFLAAALMQASVTGWHGWSSRRLKKIISGLRSQAQLPIVLSGAQYRHLHNKEQFPECLIGSTITLNSGSIIPYDGIVESGSAQLDEKCVRGIRELALRSEGDEVFAGSRVMQGQLKIRITAVDKGNRIWKVRETLLASVAGLPGRGTPTERSHSSASRIVPYTFATGTAAMLVGDLTTLAAVLRPDFATGPSISERFSNFSSICHLWDEGWLVKDFETLHDLSKTQTVLIAHPAEFAASDSTSATIPPEERISRRSVSISGRNLEIHEIVATVDRCAAYTQQLRSQTDKVAVLGCRQILSQLSQMDVIRISISPQDCLSEGDFDVLGLHAQPHRVEDLWRVLQETRRPLQHGWVAVVACNALAITGAFLVGLTSLHVVLLTNLGALAAGLVHDKHFQKSKLLVSLNHDPTDPDEVGADSVNSDSIQLAGTARESRKTSKTPDAPVRDSLSAAWNARVRARRTTDRRRWHPETTQVRAADIEATKNIDPT